MRKFFFLAFFVALLSPALFAADAAADPQMMDKFVDQFIASAVKIENEMRRYGRYLFWSLALLGFIWQWIPAVAGGFKSDFGDTFANLLRWTLTTGLFWAFFIDAPYLAELIIGSFVQIGAGIGLSDTNAFSPSKITEIGLQIVWSGIGIFQNLFANASGVTGWLKAIVLAIPASFCVLASVVAGVILALIAIEVALVLIEANLFASIAMIVVAFGGVAWTREWAIAYFKQVIGLGLHILTMILLIAIGMDVMNGIIEQFNAAISKSSGGEDMDMLLPTLMCAVSLIIAAILVHELVKRLPPRIAGLVGANTQGGLTSAMGGAMKGAAAMAGGAVAGAAAGAVGAKAVIEATKGGGIKGVAGAMTALATSGNFANAASGIRGEQRQTAKEQRAMSEKRDEDTYARENDAAKEQREIQQKREVEQYERDNENIVS